MRALTTETKIRSPTKGDHAARLGLLVQRESTGQLYGLSSAHAVGWGAVCDLEGNAVGLRTAGQQVNPISGTPDVADLIAIIRLNAANQVDFGSQQLVTKVARPMDVLGEPVSLLQRPSDGIIGHVSSVQASVTMVDEQHAQFKRYSEAVVLRLAPGKSAILGGEAGAAVIAENGKVVGILLAVGQDVAVICPLEGLCRTELFRLARDASSGSTSDPLSAICQACVATPDDLSSILQTYRHDLHLYFRELSTRRGRASMELYQNEVAHTIFRLVDFRTFAAALQRLMLRSDAPFDNVNDNWLWRASIERLRLVVPAADGTSLSSAEAPDLTLPVGEGGDVSLMRIPRLDHSIIAAPATTSLAELADNYLGRNDIAFTAPEDDPP